MHSASTVVLNLTMDHPWTNSGLPAAPTPGECMVRLNELVGAVGDYSVLTAILVVMKPGNGSAQT